MQFYYNEKMPLRILDEGQFWKHQESEHTVVIRELVPTLENEYVQALEQWQRAFNETEGRFVRAIEFVIRGGQYMHPAFYNDMMQLVQYALEQSNAFIEFLNRLTKESKAVRSNPTAGVVIHHIRRESEYFIGIAQALLSHSHSM